MSDENNAPHMSDHDAREACESIATHMQAGDVYEAFDVINDVFGDGIEVGRKPPVLSYADEMKLAAESLECAEEEAESCRRRVDRLRAGRLSLMVAS